MTDLIKHCRPPLDQKLADEWEAFCRAEYARYTAEHPQPFIARFWSGGNFFNAFENWADDRRRHYMRVGEAWWNARGYTVTSWPRHGSISVAELSEEEQP